MVFQTEPGAKVVMPTTSWQVFAGLSAWMNWKIERLLQVSGAPRSSRLASAILSSRLG